MLIANTMRNIAAQAAEIRDPKKRKEFREAMEHADLLARSAGALRKAASNLLRQEKGIKYKTSKVKK